MARQLTKRQVDELATRLRKVLVAVESGEISAGPSANAFLAGAVEALESLSGGRPFELPTEELPWLLY